MAELNNLIVKGTARIVNKVIAPEFAGTATKALQDGQGQQIDSTYIKDISVSNKVLTITKGDGTTTTISLE